MKNNTISNTFLKTGLLLSLFVAVFVGMPHAAHAQFDGSGDYSGGCCGDSYSTGVDYSTPADYGSYSTGTDYTYPIDYGSYSTGTDYTYPADYGSYSAGTDYTYPTDYGSYSTGGYMAGGYSTGGYSTGYLSGSSYMGGGYLVPHTSYIPAGNTNVNTNTNTNILNNGNSCTAGNSCNTNIVTNTTNPAPVINNVITNPPVYNPPVYNPPVCAAGFYGTYPNCYRQTYNQPIAYANPTPYISLSQAPYTGLDLGFWGTIAYWGFLILWCFVAAYLVVVKKVQNRILRSLNNFLFGDSVSTSHQVAVAAPAANVHTYSALVQTPVDAIDPFIVSQINRVRA